MFQQFYHQVLGQILGYMRYEYKLSEPGRLDESEIVELHGMLVVSMRFFDDNSAPLLKLGQISSRVLSDLWHKTKIELGLQSS